jgi:hypothetical protein
MKTEIQKTVKTDRHILKTLETFCISGNIVPVGSFVEVSPLEAHDLVNRKKAVAATQAEATANAGSIIVAPNREPMKSWVDAA